MQIVTAPLPGRGFEAQITSHRAGGWTVVEAFGVIIARWPSDDVVLTNTFVAAALHVGWHGNTIAALAFSSPAAVSRLRTRIAQRGAAAAIVRGPSGRPPSLSPSQIQRARALRNGGASFTAIARTLSASKDAIVRLLKGVAKGETPTSAQHPTLALANATLEPAVAAEPVVEVAAEPAVAAEPVVEVAAEPVVEVDAEPALDAVLATTILTASESPGSPDEEAPRAGEQIPPDGAPHTSCFAGATLINAAASALELGAVLDRASAQRPEKAVYAATTVVHALSAAWATGHPSLESMHERDPFALGVILGLSRAPSVRTLHRAIVQMTAAMDPVQLWAASMTTLLRARPPQVPVFGIDGHFKPYAGDAPIDKGWNTKRRLAEKGLATVRVNDLSGYTFSEMTVPAADSLHGHVLLTARVARGAGVRGPGRADAADDARLRPRRLLLRRDQHPRAAGLLVPVLDPRHGVPTAADAGGAARGRRGRSPVESSLADAPEPPGGDARRRGVDRCDEQPSPVGRRRHGDVAVARRSGDAGERDQGGARLRSHRPAERPWRTERGPR